MTKLELYFTLRMASWRPTGMIAMIITYDDDHDETASIWGLGVGWIECGGRIGKHSINRVGIPG